VGQAVQEGDVVALIETDKVTIDIKAKSGGIITRQFGKV
jgi:pyruvate/2-oxoglutarate dehydrogenase complex dihydrolipoamide acyltransferase (E2) component